MNTTPSTACDYLFWELRRINFSFTSSMRIDGNQAAPSIPQAVSGFVEEKFLEIEADPELQRLIAIGLEDF